MIKFYRKTLVSRSSYYFIPADTSAVSIFHRSSPFNKDKENQKCAQKIKSRQKGRTWPEAYARCVREIAAAYIANLPTAVSNNWLPRQVHIPPIMCITAPYTAMQDGRDIVDDTLPLLLQIYLSPPCLPQRSFNEHVIDRFVSVPLRFDPFHASEINICDILLCRIVTLMCRNRLR